MHIQKIALIVFLLVSSLVFASGNDDNTVLLMHLNAEPWVDSSLGGEHGNATENADVDVDTTNKKWIASAHFDGDSGFLSYIDDVNWYFGTGNFTIDFWVRFDDLTNDQWFVSQQEDASNVWELFKLANASGNKLTMRFNLNGYQGLYQMTNAWSGVATNTWYHLTFIRNGIIGLIFIDGISQTLTEDTAFSTNDVGNISASLGIGFLDSVGGLGYLDGYIDELRISKGIARHTSNFTPPTKPYIETIKQVIVVE